MGIEADTGDRPPLGLAARELPWARLRRTHAGFNVQLLPS